MDQHNNLNEEGVAATCQGKIKMTAIVAKRAAKRRKGRHSYRCSVCRGYHVGNGKSGSIKRKRLSLKWDKGNIDA